FNRVVVDTAPTGHTLRLLELPDVMDSLLGRVLSYRDRFADALAGMPGPFGDDTNKEEGADMEDLRELRDLIDRLRRVLRDPGRTDFRIVLVPEEMSVIEADRLRKHLQEFDIPVGTIVVNRVMEHLADVSDVELEAPGTFVAPDLDECAFCQRRWDIQQDALERAQDLFRDHGVRRVPLFADEVRGERMLRVVGACLTE
ncbi:MAG: ArsA family ATPase, partial [Halobacteriaceae archaeon]